MTAPVVDANLRLGAIDPEPGDDQPCTSDVISSAPLESNEAENVQREENATNVNHASPNGEIPNGQETTNPDEVTKRNTQYPDVDAVTHRLGIHCEFCFFCRGFYGPSFGLPVCGPCHAFLFPERVGEAEREEEAEGPEEKDDSGDSGNEEPIDFVSGAAGGVDRMRRRGVNGGGVDPDGAVGGAERLNDDDGVDDDFDDVVASGSSDRRPNESPSRISPTPPLPGSSFPPPSASPGNSVDARLGIDLNGSDDSPPSSAASSPHPRLPLSRSATPAEMARESLCARTNYGASVSGVGRSAGSLGVDSVGVSGSLNNGGVMKVANVSCGVPGGSGVLHRPARSDRFARLSGTNNAASASNSKSERLTEKLLQLTTTKDKELVPPRLVDSLPPEVLIAIFGFLDDLSLWTAMQVSSRWHHLIADEYPDDRWRIWLRIRWPLFEPLIRPGSWRLAYSRLVTSSPCLLCLEQMLLQNSAPIEENSWRHRRLRSELKALQSDPPEGIQATPLDRFYCHWQATITGPHGSPYEGGVFFLSMQIPPTYPMKPPVVRFLTKTFHPNISRHGDIGLDSIHHNWSLALTISKVLISIQSLLTDPFIETSMEPQISSLIRRDVDEYNRIARIWTWRYAMHDVMAVTDESAFDGP